MAFQSFHGLAITQCSLPTRPPVSLTQINLSGQQVYHQSLNTELGICQLIHLFESLYPEQLL